jgi:ABC-2 type transport system permease protein
MNGVIGAEVLKLRTMRSTWLLLAAAVLIVIAGVSGLVVSGGSLSRTSTADTAVGHVGLASLCALILGILAMAGEYRHKTITDTYLSAPARGRVLAAKLGVYVLAGVGFGLACAVTAVLAATIWWSARGATFHLSGAGVWATIAGGIAWNAAFAALGVSLGALIRNVTGAIAVALAWIALVETIAGQLLGSGLGRWLPMGAGEALGRVSLVRSAGHLSQWGGGALLAGYVLVLGALAMSATVRRDVT